jgi:hypothetical protein
MRRFQEWCALALVVFTSQASAQTYEELKKENAELRARIKALEAAQGALGVIVSYDHSSGKLVVQIGDRQRTLELKPRTHVHDPEGYEVRGPERIDKLKPGVRVEIVEEDGQLQEINIGGRRAGAHKHDHKHDHKHEHADDHDGHYHFVDPVYPGWRRPTDEYRPYSWMPPPSEGFCKDLLAGRFVETHRSPSGTPWIHPFTIEPPQLHRDLFFIYKYLKDAEGGEIDEHEAEFHLDWALTRRLGFAFAVPYLGLIGPDEQATGFGDLEFGPRVVFIEKDRFFLSSNVIFTFPTGDEDRDLGAGETTMAPFLTAWADLGSHGSWRNWNTLYVNVGPEIGLKSGDTSMSYTVVLAHTLLGPRLFFPHQHGNGNGGHQHANGNGHQHANAHGQAGHAEHGHGGARNVMSHFGPAYPPGLTSFILEFNGQSELQGERATFLQLLTGLAYSMTESGEFRFGVNFPLNRREEQFDVQFFIAFSYLF